MQINNTYHRGIKRTPEEARMNPNDKTFIELNSRESEYEGEFKKGKRETFNEGDEVWIKNDASDSQYKLTPRFGKKRLIHRVLNNDTYLVDMERSFVKRSHSQLKNKYSK